MASVASCSKDKQLIPHAVWFPEQQILAQTKYNMLLRMVSYDNFLHHCIISEQQR